MTLIANNIGSNDSSQLIHISHNMSSYSSSFETSKTGGGHSLVADSGKGDVASAIASSSDAPSNKRYKAGDREVEINNLKDMIKNTSADLKGLLERIYSFVDAQIAIESLPEADRNKDKLFTIKGAIIDMKVRQAWLVAEIAKYEAELSQLRNPKGPADAPVPAQGT